MAPKTTKKATKPIKALPAKAVQSKRAETVRGGRDAASGLPTGKRMHKPITV